MKRKLLSILFFLFLSGCWWNIDDTDKECINDCTSVSGRVLTEGGEVPVVGSHFQMDWRVRSELGGGYRNIRKFTTDKNGYFSFTFHASDPELRDHRAYLIKYIDSDKRFVGLYDYNEGYPPIGTISIQKRDTLVNKIFWLPRRSHIKVKFLNPAIEAYCYLRFKAGDIYSEDFYHYSQSGWISSKEQMEKVVEAAGNQMNYLDIYRKINGNTIAAEDSIYVSLGDTTLYEIK